ncbi:MAG: response regulator, partial [Deltaproteobacteria bacterium]
MDAPKKILVIDDEEDTSLIMAEILKQEGYAVKKANDGLEALERIEAEPFDLILSDIRMPNLDGMQLLAELARRKVAAKVIMMTAYAELDTYITANDLGAFEYIR